MKAAEADALLEAARGGDNDACEQMMEENAGLIWSVVRRYYGRGTDPEDLYQLGCLGFLKAVRGFDPAFGCQFSTYAVPKIAGEIRRYLRDDGAVKVSRGVKERAGAIRQARDRLSHTLGREPTLSELSAETGLEPEDIAAAEEANLPVASLQMEAGEDGFTLESMLGTDGMEEGGGAAGPPGGHRCPARAGAAGHFSAVLQEPDSGQDRQGPGGEPGPDLPH